MSNHLEHIARDWLLARDVIVAFLREIRPVWGEEALNHNAAALIARLASHDPPILLHVRREEQAGSEQLGGRAGDWGFLRNEPCRYCRRPGGVYFLTNDHVGGLANQ